MTTINALSLALFLNFSLGRGEQKASAKNVFDSILDSEAFAALKDATLESFESRRGLAPSDHKNNVVDRCWRSSIGRAADL